MLVGGLTKDVEVELHGGTRTASPGGLLVLRYTLTSYTANDERVRFRLHLPAGWTLLDREVEAQEQLLEAWNWIRGEIRVAVGKDAHPGERHRVHVVAEVIGEPGGAAVFSFVQILRKGGLQAGQVGLTGTTTVQASNFAVESFDGARYGGVADLSGTLARNTTLSLNYRQGPRESALTNYRLAQEETRWSGNLRRPGWNLEFGNQISSIGQVLTGPSVQGRGIVLRRTQGPLIGDLIVAQPSTFNTAPAGHLLRGSVGLSGRSGRIALAISDFGRPVGGYSTAPIYPEDIDPDSLEQLERERSAAERAPSNQVRSAGLDMELKHAKVHHFTLRGGYLRLSNGAGDTIQDPAVEAQYAFNHRRANLHLRWRQMPQSLKGISLPGSEASLNGSLRVVGEWQLTGRAYQNRRETLGNAFHSESEGASAGVRYFKQGWRLDLSGNFREWSYGQHPTTARTASLSLGVPLGPLNASGYAEHGEQRRDTLHGPSATYRGDLRWSGKAGSTSWSASYFETLNSPPRLRTDLLGSLKLGDWELAGGAWATRGWKVGGDPGIWTQLGVPVTYDLLLSVGIEHAPPAYGQAPAWLGTVGIRKKVAFPLPFLRDGSVSRGMPLLPLAAQTESNAESR